MGLFQRKRYGKIILYVLLVILFFVSMRCSARLINVDIDNSIGPWVGSSDHPFFSIQDAVDDADAFDSIIVHEGTYDEQIVIDKPVNISGNVTVLPIISGRNISDGAIISISTDDVFLHHLQISDGSIALCLENASYSFFSNLTFFSNQLAVQFSNSSTGNHFFSNNFVNNTIDVINPNGNHWNTSTKGNYWDDYIGNDTNNDGIGDDPYHIFENESIDWFPLMHPITHYPLADFLFSPVFPSTADAISFTSVSNDSDGFIESWFWDFGDNHTSIEQNPVHQFQSSGNYSVTLSVTDNLEMKNSTEKTVIVLNIPPTASFKFNPKNPTDIQLVSFEDISTDTDGVILNWTWEFGDNHTSFEQNPVHQFADDNIYIVNLTVLDDSGDMDSFSQSITVSNVAPVASFTFTFSNVTALADQPIYFHDASIDPDGSIVSREWSFDDGSNSSEKNPSHIFSQKGSYTVSLTVIDDDGETTEVTKKITVFDTIQHDEVISEFSLFDIVFVVFLVAMIILVIVLSKKYG